MNLIKCKHTVQTEKANILIKLKILAFNFAKNQLQLF